MAKNKIFQKYFLKLFKRGRCCLQTYCAGTAGAPILSSFVAYLLFMTLSCQGIIGFRGARNSLIETSHTAAPALPDQYGREIMNTSELVYISSGLEFIRALADPAVKLIRIALELVAVSGSAWDTAGFNSPLLVRRNVTVEGDPRFEDWPSLSLGNVVGKVRLANEVTLAFFHVILMEYRDNPSRAPGLDLLAPTLAGEISYVMLAFIALHAPVCFPGNFRLEDFEGLPRPEQFPGTQQNLFSIPQVGCINDTRAHPLKRCWPDRGLMKEMIVYGADVDPLTGTTTPNNLIIFAFNVSVICQYLVDGYCLMDLNKAPLVCFMEAFQRYRRQTAADAVGNSSTNHTPQLSGGGAAGTPRVGGMAPPAELAAPAVSGASRRNKTMLAAVICGSVAGTLLLIAVSVVLLRHRNRCKRLAAAPSEGHGGFSKGGISLGQRRSGNDNTRESQPQTYSEEPSAIPSADGKPSDVATAEAVIIDTRCKAAGKLLGESSSAFSRADQTRSSTPLDISADEPLQSSPLDAVYQNTSWKPNMNDGDGITRKGTKLIISRDLPVTPFTPPRAEVALDVRLLAAAVGARLKGQRKRGVAAAAAAAAGDPAGDLGDLATPDRIGLGVKEISARDRIGSQQADSSSAKYVGTSTITSVDDVMQCVSEDNGLADGTYGNRGASGEDGGGGGGSGHRSNNGRGPPVVQLLPVVLGKGSFGRVMQGLYNGRSVAVKVIANNELGIVWGGQNQLAAAPPAPAPHQEQQQQQQQPGVIDQTTNNNFIQSFEREVQVLSRCQHPNIVQLLAACVTPPRLCLVMELMETSLELLMYRNATQPCMMPLQKALTIGISIASALAYLHPTIVHRDLKPANVLITNPESDQPTVKLADFGLSRLRTTVKSTKNPEAGTPPYMAPECFDMETKQISHQADIYSLGVLLWEMLAGKRPWIGMGPVAIAFIVTYRGARLPLSELPSERCPPKLTRLLVACWDVDPARRPAAAEISKELTLALERIRQESSVRATAGAVAGGEPGHAAKDAAAAKTN